jgi:peroxiredoxin
MKHFPKYLLPGILAIIVIVGAAASFYFGNLTPTPANAEEKPDQLAKEVLAKAEDNPDIASLLKKMDMGVAADHPMMPDFELLDVDGKSVRLSQFKGETVLLGFFTTWWSWCQKELPSLESLKHSYKDKPFKVLLVSVMEPQETIKNYLKREKLSLRVLLDNFGKVSNQYNVRSHPVKFLIDSEGKLMATGFGYRDWDSEEMNKLVNTLIQNAGKKPKA